MIVARVARCIGFGILFLLLPLMAAAQDVSSATIVGVVKDTSGAVLPGVTVEAGSPALIERVRSAVTDSEGRFRLIDLRPGAYSVTFTLPGFKTVVRNGIDLSTGFTATINIDLSVGAVEETITVTGQAPVVDTRSVAGQQVFSGETLRTLPIGRNAGIYTALIPGATQGGIANQDVGGTKGESTQQFAVHGGRTNDMFQLRDGMFAGSMIAVGGNFNTSVNQATIQETQVQPTGGLTAEAQSGGVQVNFVSRDGGNQLHGTFLVDGSGRSLQSDNLSPELEARGLKTSAFLKKLYDVSVGIGGPIVKDKLWFFGSARDWQSASYQPGVFFNKTQGTLFYTPDPDRQGFDQNLAREWGMRGTWQASQKNKVTVSSIFERNCNCYFGIAGAGWAPEAAASDWYSPHRLTQANWTMPASNNVLLQAGFIEVGGLLERRSTGEDDDDYAVLNRLTNFWYGANGRGLGITANRTSMDWGQHNINGSLSFVTGAHSLKLGGVFLKSFRDYDTHINHSLSYTFAGVVPESVTYYALPFSAMTRIRQIDLFAQEQWTIQRMTIYGGLRFNSLYGTVPAQHLDAGPFVGARDFAPVDGAPDWKDISPRVGVAVDLFGHGRTAVKATLGKFVAYEGNGGIVFNSNPVNLLVTSATRTWADTNGDYIPQESEQGPLSNANFGKVVNPTTRYSDDVLKGWGNRGYSWQGSVALQQELLNGIGVGIGYFRTQYGNQNITDNLLASPADYDSYCITSPTDAQLPGGGGERICGLVDIKPAKFGQVNNLVDLASKYGKMTEVYNGVDLTINARFAKGGLISGGFSTGQTATNACEIYEKLPEAAPTNAPTRFCKISPPWSAQTQIKLSGSYELPYSVRTSVNYQNIPGVATTALYTIVNDQAKLSLGRDFAAGTRGTARTELIQPTSYYVEKRLNQLNLSFSRVFRFSGGRIQPKMDLANALNANTVNTLNTTYGGPVRSPQYNFVRGILAPRLIKFGVQVDF